MARTCFVVRPFGKKTFRRMKKDAAAGADSFEDVEVDFETIHAKLIAPAMEEVGLVGGTTAAHQEAGNIRTDMFDGLASADIVIADISIQNANVYYELGARHGLRNRRTVMIRFRGDETPFDIETDRYLEYAREAPENSVGELVGTLRATLEAVRIDSPIYDLLPDLRPPDPNKLALVPVEFRHAVEHAEAHKHYGWLELLATEAGHFAWANGGLRLVGHAQFQLKQFEGARETWSELAQRSDGDAEAYLMLATAEQRLGDLVSSNQAVEKALAIESLSSHDRAEAEALMGRNAKARWKEQWGGIKDPEERRSKALRSRYLADARKHYRDGFGSDLNHHFSGINALGLSSITVSLADEFPRDWRSLFPKDRDAENELANLREEHPQLAGAVSLAVERHRDSAAGGQQDPRWAELSLAEIQLLSGEEPGRVAAAYAAALEDAAEFFFDSAGGQLVMYDELGVATQAIQAIRRDVPGLAPEAPVGAPATKKEQRVILFSGHRLDAPDRATPRFPAAKEPEARRAIEDKVREILERHPGAEFNGMAGGANGGDILFHEACEALGVPTELYLAIPTDDYARLSVIVPSDPEWKNRYEAIRKRCEQACRCWQLQESERLPLWLGAHRENYSVWERNNLWTLHSALAKGGGAGTDVILLWDGEEGDGPGGTRHMSEAASRRGANVHHLPTKQIFNLD